MENEFNYETSHKRLIPDTDSFYDRIPMSKRDIPQKTLKPNSKTELYAPLTGLTIELMMNMVLSNGFVPADVKYNTVIWDNWDIFSECKYLWKVVRKKPSAVKAWGSNQEVWACIPAKEKNLYEPKYFNAISTRCDILTDEPVSLELALLACENNIVQRRKTSKKPFEVEFSPYHVESKDNWEDLLEWLEPENYTTEKIVAFLRRKGIDEQNIELLCQKRSYIHHIAIDTIIDDVEPSDELLKKIIGTYKNISLLTMKEVQEVLQYYPYRSAKIQTVTRKKSEAKNNEIDSFLDFI